MEGQTEGGGPAFDEETVARLVDLLMKPSKEIGTMLAREIDTIRDAAVLMVDLMKRITTEVAEMQAHIAGLEGRVQALERGPFNSE